VKDDWSILLLAGGCVILAFIIAAIVYVTK
jgi:hypothetical protein